MATSRGKRRKWQILFSWAPKSLQIVTTTMKLKDPCFKSMTNLDSILKGRDITLPTQVHIVKAVVFRVVVYNAKVRLTRKKAECQRIDAFKLWCWRRIMRFHWVAGKSNQSIIKEINPEYSLEGLMLKLKHHYSGHLMWRANTLEKILMLEKTEGRRRRGCQKMR